LLNRSCVSGISGTLGFDAPNLGVSDVFGAADAAGADVPAGVNERGTVRVIADSRLTNASDIRAQLEARGHRFQGATDSELIAHAYEEWGSQGVARLRGPFACAVWDAEARRLVLARDHIGLRRLFYALLPGGGVAFASDIHTLFTEHGIGRDWSPEGIDAYLALGYVPAPLTAYRRISKLEPAQLLQVEGRGFRLEQYWDVPRATPISVALDERLATVDARLRAALRRPDEAAAGLLYSGSTASTVLLAAAAPGVTVPITVDVEQDASELTRSESAATWLGHARQLELAAPDAMTLAGEFASHVHEPIADPSAIVQLAVLRAARRHVDSAFAAHGASILWAGQAGHDVERHRGHLLDAPAARRAYAIWDDQHRRGIYTRQFSWQVRESDPFSRHLALHASHPSNDPLERALYVHLRTSLADNALACADRAAAAADISLRFPFLDRDLVVIAATTPSTVKQRGSTGMHALRRLLLRQVPRMLMPPARPQGPRHDWLRAALAAMVPAMLLAPRFDGRGIVSRVALRRIWGEHRSGRHDHARHLWSLLMLELWFRRCVDSDAANEPLEYAVLKAVA
jgi:asparagine synthase (glutamine-hydrolysing)